MVDVLMELDRLERTSAFDWLEEEIQRLERDAFDGDCPMDSVLDLQDLDEDF